MWASFFSFILQFLYCCVSLILIHYGNSLNQQRQWRTKRWLFSLHNHTKRIKGSLIIHPDPSKSTYAEILYHPIFQKTTLHIFRSSCRGFGKKNCNYFTFPSCDRLALSIKFVCYNSSNIAALGH